MKSQTRKFATIIAVILVPALILAGCNESTTTEESRNASAEVIQTSAVTQSGGTSLDEMIGMERVEVRPLARGEYTDGIDKNFNITLDGGSTSTEADVRGAAESVTAELTFEPEGFVGWHTHPGPVIVTVVSGALTVVNELDCVARVYEEGQAFVDPGQGNIHVAHNASGEETRAYALFMDVPQGDGPTDLLDNPGDC